MFGKQRIFKVSVASTDVEAFLASCREAEWYAVDTGERVMTDEGPDAEAVLLVEPTPLAEAEAAASILR